MRAFARDRLAGAGIVVRLDPRGTTARRYGIEYFPRFVALDRTGRKIRVADSFDEILPAFRQ